MAEKQHDHWIPDPAEHLIRSKFVDQTFRIRVFQPLMRKDASERFPVLYATDADKLFDALAALSKEMQLFGEVQRFILVGIGYENRGAADALRMRDLLTRDVQQRLAPITQLLIDSPLVSGVEDIRTLTGSTDASAFLQFIRRELKPFIESRYPIGDQGASFAGFSAGGSFGLYALFSEPDTFQRYILNSPGTSFNGHHFGIEMVAGLRNPSRPIQARLFMSVGELEEFYAQFNLTSGYYRMAKYLMDAKIPGLELICKMLPEERHSSVWAASFAHGLRVMFPIQEREGHQIDFNVTT